MNEKVTIFEEDGSMIFATKHEWNRITEDQFNIINGYSVICMFCGTGGVFQLMRDANPLSFPHDYFKLLKIDADEETGKIVMYDMDITADEAAHLTNIRNALWATK